MALTPRLTNLAANAAADAVTVLLNSGKLRIYDGTQPAAADTAIRHGRHRLVGQRGGNQDAALLRRLQQPQRLALHPRSGGTDHRAL